MRFAGINVAAERHYVAIVDETGALLQKPTAVSEEAAGYRQLRELLREPEDCLVAMEATGHYWRNLFTFLTAEGFSISLLNPLRGRRFAEEDLAPKPTRSTRWGSRASLPRSGPLRPHYQNRRSSSCVSW